MVRFGGSPIRLENSELVDLFLSYSKQKLSQPFVVDSKSQLVEYDHPGDFY